VILRVVSELIVSSFEQTASHLTDTLYSAIDMTAAAGSRVLPEMAGTDASIALLTEPEESRHNVKRSLSAVLLSAVLLLPMAAAKDDDHHHRQKRYYDREGHDYHVYDQQEDRAYRTYLQEQHREYRDLGRETRNRQKEYWRWRHLHANVVVVVP
jgi:hypothetical protein